MGILAEHNPTLGLGGERRRHPRSRPPVLPPCCCALCFSTTCPTSSWR